MNGFWQFCCASATALLLLAAPGDARAAAPPPVAAALAPQDTAVLQRVAAYLQGIHTMTAKFQQAVDGGGDATGYLWVQRPGRMRFQYDPPNQLLMFADSFSVYYWDPELKQMSQVALKSTPAWFLLRDPISFTDGVTVTRFEHSGNTVQVTVVQTAEPDQGSLTMEFTENPLVLRQWIVVDQKGKVTHVTLSQTQYGMALDPNLFQYHDPK
jgi:outer membrane lipoprotein-sorting protein